MIEFGPGGKRQHQADPVAIEEGQIRRHAEKVLHAELVAIEVNGTIDVMRVNGDLLDCGKTELVVIGHGGGLLKLRRMDTANREVSLTMCRTPNKNGLAEEFTPAEVFCPELLVSCSWARLLANSLRLSYRCCFQPKRLWS